MRNRKYMARVSRLVRSNGRRRGRESEALAVDAFVDQDFHPPTWFHGIEPSTHEQDQRGIDAVVHTDVGDIYVQIKSSLAGEEKFRARQEESPRLAHIVLAIVRVGESSMETRATILRAVEERRADYLARRSGTDS